MSNKGLLDVIEDMLEEGINDHINKITMDNIKDGKNFNPDGPSANTQGVEGQTTGAAMDAGGDKDVGHSNHGHHPSAASPDTQGVLGSESGSAMDAGGDKDVGGSKGDNASDASPDTQGVLGKTTGAALDAGGDRDVGKLKEESDDDDSDDDDKDDNDEMEEGYASDAQRKAVHASKNEKKESVEEETDEELEEKLHGDQHKLDHNHNGKIDGSDMKDVRKKGATAHLTKEESDEIDHDGETVVEAEDEKLSKASHVTANDHLRPEQEKGDNMPKDYKAGDPMGSKAGAAMDAGGDKDVGGKKGSNPSEASSDTQGVLGKTKGAAMDAGGDKDVGKLKEEEEIEEDFKQRAAVIFEATVGEKVNMIREQMEAEFETKLAEEKARLNEETNTLVQEAITEWLQENALEIKYSLRTEIAENFIKGLKGLFEESYIEIPEEDYSAIDELTEAVEEQKEQIDALTEELKSAKAFILESKRKEVVAELSEDLTQTQAVRLEKLAEGLEAEDIKEFKEKVTQLKEGYFDPSNQKQLFSLTEEILESNDDMLVEDSVVGAYAQYLAKTVR